MAHCRAEVPGNTAGSRLHVRLILAPDLGKSERRAVMDATRAFARFGVRFDHVDGQKSLMQDRPLHPAKQGMLIHGTKRGEEINEIVTAGTSLDYRDMDMLLQRAKWEEVWPTRLCLGMGVTPHAITGYIPPLETLAFYPGLTRPGEAGIISTYLDIEATARQELATLRAVAKHELGHLLGKAGHCASHVKGGCLMEGWAVNPGFVERVAKAGLDICRSCEAEIRRWIRSQAHEGRA